MKKTRVLSIRLPVEALQSCFDLSDLAGAPTTVAGTAIARSISLLTANLREAGKLPVYSSTELEKLTEKWAAKINPSSMPSLEVSSQVSCTINPSTLSDSFDSSPKEFNPYQTVEVPPNFNIKSGLAEEALDCLSLDEISLEEEILKQMKEVELEDELDLLDKILIS